MSEPGVDADGATIVGIDIGGTGIKGAPVDPVAGKLTRARYRLETPRPADVDSVTAVVGEVARHCGPADRIGVTFPGVVTGGVIRTAANMHPSWVDVVAPERFAEVVGCPVTVVNDADAAGVAEVTFGAGRGRSGVVIVLTLGTGIGSAVFLDGKLLPNTELGHLELDGTDAEHRASELAREREGLTWPEWAQRVQRYLRHVEDLLQPELFIIGGGVSKRADKFLPLIQTRTPVVPAALRNEAGIIGAALMAAQAG